MKEASLPKQPTRVRLKAFKYLLLILALLCPITHSKSDPIRYYYKIDGLSGEILENAKKIINIKHKYFENTLNNKSVHHLHQQIPTLVQKALQPYGYFSPNISTTLSETSPNNWLSTIKVSLGKPLKITSVQFSLLGEAKNDPNFQKLLSHFPIKVGQIFKASQYTRVKNELLNSVTEKGYLDAELTKKKVLVDLNRKTLVIILELDSGKRYTFGNIRFSKIELSEGLLRRFLNFQAGEPYDEAKMRSFEQTLSNTSFFKEVEINPLIHQATLEKSTSVPIDVHLALRKARQYTFGIGYGTDSGARGLIGVKLRHITPEGQHLNALLKASEVDTNLAATYTILGHNPVTDSYNLSIGLDKQRQRLASSDSLKMAASYVTDFHSFQQTIGLNALYDRSYQNDGSKVWNILLYLNTDWLKVNSDDPVQPSRGTRVNFGFLGASRAALSSLNFFQFYLSLKTIRTLWQRNRLILRTHFGYTRIHDINELPVKLQFYAGGAKSIRGYSYNSIGPGKALLTASAEWQHLLFKHIYMTGFYDMGNASNKHTNNIKRGVGLGLMMLTKVGAIELTAAKALDLRDKPILIQFSMGLEL